MYDLFKRPESTSTEHPDEAAPAYDNIMHMHEPGHNFAHSSSSPGYVAVPQNDVEHDVEHNAPLHNHGPAPTELQQPQATLAQTIVGALTPKPHVHCEECDRQTARRERREAMCCTKIILVIVFLVLSFMIMVIVTSAMH